MSRIAVIYSAVCVMIAASLTTWSHAQMLKCQPQFVANSAATGNPTGVWSTNRALTRHVPDGVFTDHWTTLYFTMKYKFTCGGGNDSSICKICRWTQVNYFSPTNHIWIQAPSGFVGYRTDSGPCQSTITQSSQIGYDFPINAGTTVQCVWNAALFDPSIGDCNNGEAYDELTSAQFVVPADGS